MKLQNTIFRMTAVALTAGSLSLAGNLFAQADNPYLKKAEAKRNGEPTGKSSEAATKMSEKDQKFVLNAASAGAQKIQDGMIAEKKAKSSETRQVASRVVSGLESSNKQLIEMAKKKGLGVTTDNIKPRDMGTQNYDAQYLYTVETDNQQDIKMFEKEMKSGDDAEIKAWAAKMLPTLKSNLALAKSTRKKMK